MHCYAEIYPFNMLAYVYFLLKDTTGELSYLIKKQFLIIIFYYKLK